MRILVLLFALLMPVVAWMDQAGIFGPTNGEVSNRYPTLIVAAGYAFSIWGLIFVLDIVHGATQLAGTRRRDRALTLAAMPAAGGFLLTTAWMPLFSMGLYWVCLAVIFGALACIATAALQVERHGQPQAHRWARLALGMHAGWLTLAAFLNLALVIVAEQLLPTDRMLGWSLPLLLVAAAALLALNRALRGNLAYAGAGLWGLAAVAVKQSQSSLAGGDVMAWAAIAVAIGLVVQTAMLQRRRATAGATLRSANR